MTYETARFFPDSRRVLFCGTEPGRAIRCYVQEVSGGKPRPVTPDGMTEGVASSDGRTLAARGTTGGLFIVDMESGRVQPVPGTKRDDALIRWSSDGRSLLVFGESSVPSSIERIDPATGRRELIRTLGSADQRGVIRIESATISENQKSVAYGNRRMISHLYLVQGAR